MAKRLKKKKPSLLFRVLKALYYIALVLSILIVVLFLAHKIFIRQPEVEGEVTLPVTTPAPEETSAPADTDAPAESEEVVVYTRREGVYTCLLTGSDDGDLRADTIMLGCFDSNSKTASLISIPRDTLVLRNGKNSKINAVYSNGKGEAMAEKVSQMLGIPVDYYVSVDLDAFGAIVKTIGGVNFDVPIDMDYDDPYQDLHIHLKAGYQKLDAKGAIGVVRFRHNNDGSGYPDQDYGRVKTQRNFLTALVSQTITVSNVTKVTELIGIVSKYVETNMPLDDMIWFATAAIGLDLDTALTTATPPSEWISPYVELDDEGTLELLNELFPVYTTPLTIDVLNIHHK